MLCGLVSIQMRARLSSASRALVRAPNSFQLRGFIETLVRAYGELTDRLSKLAKPMLGQMRVYRGQTRDFPRMLPTGLREQPGAKGNHSIWH